MEARKRNFGGQSNPTPLLKQQVGRKIPVVYYLSRNRLLEHPHFIEVSVSSLEGLFLKDVLNRLNVLRGMGMPAMYSWSCKRSYKNGFVWHDLADDDLIIPTNGNEFVLKGSELLDQSPSDKTHHGRVIGKLQNLKIPESETPTSSRTNGTSSSSSSTTFKESKTPSPPSPSPTPLSPSRGLEDEQRLLAHRLGSSRNISSKEAFTSLAECRVYKPNSAADASTQTDDGGKTHGGRKNMCIRGVSTEDSCMDLEFEQKIQSKQATGTEGFDMCRDEIFRRATEGTLSSAATSSGGKMDTLESLIRADASKINSFRILEEEEIFVPTGPRVKATNMLMQLITCGSISVKDHHSFDLVPNFKPKFPHKKFPSPIFASTMVLGELNYFSENPRFIGLRIEDKEYFSGSLLETKKDNEDTREGLPSLKRSSSYNADRCGKLPSSTMENERFVDSSHSNCLPRPVKITSNKPTRNDIISSPMVELARNSSVGLDCHHSSIGESKRMTDVPSVKGSSMRLDSFIDNKEKTIKIEERLISGARVIIQSRASYDDTEDCFSF